MNDKTKPPTPENCPICGKPLGQHEEYTNYWVCGEWKVEHMPTSKFWTQCPFPSEEQEE